MSRVRITPLKCKVNPVGVEEKVMMGLNWWNSSSDHLGPRKVRSAGGSGRISANATLTSLSWWRLCERCVSFGEVTDSGSGLWKRGAALPPGGRGE